MICFWLVFNLRETTDIVYTKVVKKILTYLFMSLQLRIKSFPIPGITRIASDVRHLRLGGMLWPKTGVTNHIAQLGLPDNGLAIKRVGCLLCCMAMIYDLWYGSLDIAST